MIARGTDAIIDAESRRPGAAPQGSPLLAHVEDADPYVGNIANGVT